MSQNDNAVKTQGDSDDTSTVSATDEILESEIAEEDVDTSGYDEEDNVPERLETEDKEEEAEQSDEPDKSDETEADNQQKEADKQLSPKAENRVQQAVNERNQARTEAEQLRSQLEELRAREAQFAQEQDLINEVNPETGEYYTPQEIERIAWQQSRETQAQQVATQRYELEVQQNQQAISSEARRALQDFPMFDETNKDAFNPELAAQADQLLGQSIIYETDINGQVIMYPQQDGSTQPKVIGAHISPYQLYKSIADATKANAAQYEANAQRATEKMLANADPGSSATQAKMKTEDDDMFAAYDEAI